MKTNFEETAANWQRFIVQHNQVASPFIVATKAGKVINELKAELDQRQEGTAKTLHLFGQAFTHLLHAAAKSGIDLDAITAFIQTEIEHQQAKTREWLDAQGRAA